MLLKDQNLIFNHAWQLIGFSPEQRDTFIATVLLTESKVQTCHNFLNMLPELELLSLVPVTISLITGLVDSPALLSNITTLTDVYSSLMLFLLEKELIRIHPDSAPITSLDLLPPDMMVEYRKLAEVAYKGLVARQITFSPTEFSEIASLGHKYKKVLGLFHIITVMITSFTRVEYLSCPHLTIQEFLSAWYISQKSPDEIVSIFHAIFSNNSWPAMKVCIRFLCGILSHSTNEVLTSITRIIINNLHRDTAPLLDHVLLFSYNNLHLENTEYQLSVLPYVLETNNTSILTSYRQKLRCNQTIIPHFYLSNLITPVCFYKFPQHCSISNLSISITLLTPTQLTMLHQSFASINIAH